MFFCPEINTIQHKHFFTAPFSFLRYMAILPSHKYGIEYVEHCAVRSADDQLVFIRRKDAIEQHFNIPSLNTAVLLMGPGTSLTQQAARLCAEGNVLVGFCGGGMAPVYLGAMNAYTEPSYGRNWIAMFDVEARRLAMAKKFQFIRIDQVLKSWKHLAQIEASPAIAAEAFQRGIRAATSVEQLLLAEAAFTKALYAMLAKNFGKEFTRRPRADSFANEMLDAGNYLAYGLAACCLWILGIPQSYPVMHGKTRRGALVFDVADLVKDACILPNAFISAALGESESAARKRMLAFLDEQKALALMFATTMDC